MSLKENSNLKLDMSKASPMMMNKQGNNRKCVRGNSKNSNDTNNTSIINNIKKKSPSPSNNKTNNNINKEGNDSCLELLPIITKIAKYVCGANCNNVSDEVIEEEKRMIFVNSGTKINHHTSKLRKETNIISSTPPSLTKEISSTSCSSNGTSKTMNSSTNSLLSIDINDTTATTRNKPTPTSTSKKQQQSLCNQILHGKECNEINTSNKDLKGTYERYRIQSKFEKMVYTIQSNYKIKPYFYNIIENKKKNMYCSQNVYSEPLGKTFMIRSKDYLCSNKKVASNVSMFSLVCVENIPLSSFSKHSKKNKIINRHNISKQSSSYVQKFRTACKKNNIIPPFILAINLVLPWGNLCSYYYRPPSSPDNSKNNNKTASDKLWNEFLNGTKTYRSSILKLIPRIVSGPWVVKKAVGASPVIIGKKLPVDYYDCPNGHYLEICLDVSNGSQMANSIANIVASKSDLVTVDLGFVLEGHKDEYLPERILAAFRLNHITL